MNRPTMADLLISSRTAATFAPWFFVRKLVDMPVPASVMERYHKTPISGMAFVMVLSDLPVSELLPLYSKFSNSDTFTVVYITPDTPIGVASSMALMATAVIVHSTVDLTPDEATAVAAIVTSRGAPLLAVDDGNTLPPIILTLADTVYENAADALSALAAQKRMARFPCFIEFTERGMAIMPGAPLDFFSAYEQGTPLFDLALQRMTMLVMKAKDDEVQFNPQQRYYVVLIGDMPMAIEDEQGNTVYSIYNVKPPEPKASSPHN